MGVRRRTAPWPGPPPANGIGGGVSAEGGAVGPSPWCLPQGIPPSPPAQKERTPLATSSTALQKRRYGLPFVIGASAAATVIECYDFYLYGVLAAFFSPQLFPPCTD